MRETKVVIGVILALVLMVFMAKNQNKTRQQFNNYLIDSSEIIAQQQEQKRIEDSITRVQSFKDSIKVVKTWLSTEYGNYMDAHIVWKNNTKRTIKYITFKVAGINRVGDTIVQTRNIGITTDLIIPVYEYLHVIGPIKSGTTYGWNTYWESLYRSKDKIKNIFIAGYEIDFMDGDKVEVDL